MNQVKWGRVLFLSMLAFGLAIPAVAQVVELNDSQEPGSVLVFHKFRTGTVTIDDVATPRTEIEISVTCPSGSEPCEQGTDVKLKAHWVCPGPQENDEKFICQEVDFYLFTTVKGTIFFGPGSGSPAPPCSEGYLIVWVVDESDSAIKYDALIGNAVIRDSSGSAGAYNAVPIQAVSALATGAFTDVDGEGDLDFNGTTEYKAVTGRIFGTVRYERPANALPRIDTFLTLLTLDVKSNRPNYPTFVDLIFYSFDEVPISTFVEFICYRQVRLTTINGSLNEAVLGRKGLFESIAAEKVAIFGIDDTAGPVTLLAIVETQERNGNNSVVRQYSYSTYNDSVPVETAFEP